MKTLWKYLENKNMEAAFKYKAAFWIAGVCCAAAGLLLWFLIGAWTLKTVDWMICFVGYPVLLAELVVYIYGCNHEFHNGIQQ